MQEWFLMQQDRVKNLRWKLSEIFQGRAARMLKGALREGWTLLIVPVDVYGRSFFQFFFGFYGAYAALCMLPGIITLVAYGLYRVGKGSLWPVIFGVLSSIVLGCFFTYAVAEVELLPILPKNILEVLTFIQKLNVTWLLIASSSILSSLYIITHLIKYGFKAQVKVKQENSHGSARFASYQEVKALNQNEGIPIGCLIKGKLSTDIEVLKQEIKRNGTQEIIRLNPHHMVLVAPSGAGKGVGIIIPTLLDYNGPVLVTDIKSAENFHVTSRRRRELGREVYTFDPFNKTGQLSGSINVLDFLNPQSKEVVDDAAMIAAIFVPMSLNVSGNSKHFYDRARATIQAFILYVIFSEDIKQEDKTLFHIYKLLSQAGDNFTILLKEIAEQEDLGYGQPARVASALLSTSPEELSGILNTVRNELSIFDSPLIQEVTAKTTINLHHVILDKADLFLCIPIVKLKTYGRLLRLIVSMAFVVAQQNEKRTKKPLLMVLDEMPLLGAIPAVEEALIAGRGYGVKILAVAQNMELIQSFSPERWETFLSSNLLAFIGTTGLKDSEYISRLLGNMTIETVSKSKGESQQRGDIKSDSSSENQGESHSYQGRPILTPDEVRCLGEDVVLVFNKDTRPIILKKIKYYQHETWRGKYTTNPLEKEDCF